MKSLWDAGLAHVVSGASSFEELQRVVEMPGEAPEPLPAGVPMAPDADRGAGPRGGATRVSGASPRVPIRTPRAATPVAVSRLTGERAFELLGTVLLVEDEETLRGVLRDLL